MVSASIRAAYPLWLLGDCDGGIYRIGSIELFISKGVQPEYMQCQVIFQAIEIS